MSTNPGNTVRIRSRNGGRASVYEANMWCQPWTTGLMDGSGVTQNTSADMNVLVGGSSTNPDVVIASNAAQYNIALDLVSKQAIKITAPAANSRITLIVAYTNDLSLPSTETGTTGSPASCGLIVVNGATSATPAAPSDSDIRAAITADGASGSQATYGIIASITVASTTTTITNALIAMNRAQLSTIAIKDKAITSDKIDFATLKDGMTVMPFATKAVSIGYGITATLYRMGNLVFVSMNTVVNAVSQIDSTNLSETLPSGYRPEVGTSGSIVAHGTVGTANQCGWLVNANGTMIFSNIGAVSGATRIQGTGAWITDNPWPAS